jgi:hypothetical protein
VGRIDESSAILEKAAKMNKRPYESIKSDLLIVRSTKTPDQIANRGDFTDLFRTPNMRAKTIFMTFNWFVCGLAFFG